MILALLKRDDLYPDTFPVTFEITAAGPRGRPVIICESITRFHRIVKRAMIYTGVDLIEIERIKETYERFGDRFLSRCYTEGEQRYARGRAPQLASRFAAKEAVMKALGTGVKGVAWTEVEVIRRRGGPPEIALHRRAKDRAEKMGIKRLAVSLSHSREFAIASVVAEAD